MKTERPVYLSLTAFAWPFAAIASITHRVTGVLLFAALAYLLWLLGIALESPAGFERAAATLEAPFPKLVMLAVLAVLLVLFMAAGLLERMLGRTGINVVTRLLGMLLAALSVQFVLDGLRDFGFAG